MDTCSPPLYKKKSRHDTADRLRSDAMALLSLTVEMDTYIQLRPLAVHVNIGQNELFGLSMLTCS